MSDLKTAHCRLCAYPKPYSKLINLQSDEDKKRKLLEKLSRLSIEVFNLDSINDHLPKTVCFTCVDSLDKAFNFILDVESGQGVLNEIVLVVKQEFEDRSDDSFGDTYDETVKIEDGDSKLELDTGKNELNNNNLKDQKRNTKRSVDAIPLSELTLSWKDYSWMCAYCDTIFPNVDELKAHSVQYHGCCNAYRCVDCNLRKLKLDSFIIHVKQHRKYLKQSCYKCHMVFPRVHDASVHKTIHINSEYKCPGCNNTFTSLDELTKHCETYNKDKKLRGVPVVERLADNLTCIFCKKTFKHKGSLSTHLLTHTDRKRNHICEKCGKCFLNKQNLEGHMMLHEDLRPHQCEICKQCFRTAYGLRKHIGVHDGTKPFACEKCGRCFRLQKQLRSHSIIHTDSLPHVCNFCHKSFRFRTILVQHIRQHTGVKPYSCQICERDFTNWPNYNKHMKRRHGMEMAKKKHTPDGLFPINPTTGEVVVEPQTKKTLEWKKKIMESPKGRGKPKVTQKSCNIRIKLLSTSKVGSQKGRKDRSK